MKVLVVSDDQGRILSLSKSGDIGKQPSAIAEAGILPEPGQHVHYVDLPAGLEKKSLLDLHHELRVDRKGDQARFVKAQEFRELSGEKY